MKDKHTGGEIELVLRGELLDVIYIEDESGLDVCDLYHKLPNGTIYPKANAKANGERLVVCWNALESIPTAALSSGVVGEMVEFIKGERMRLNVVMNAFGLTNEERARYENIESILSKLEANNG